MGYGQVEREKRKLEIWKAMNRRQEKGPRIYRQFGVLAGIAILVTVLFQVWIWIN